MTREEIMALQGRELDAAVHKRVFGRLVKWATPSATNNGGELAFKFPFDPDMRMRIPHYSADIAAAWQVVEWMFERGFYPEISYHSDGTGRHDKAKVDVIFHTEDHYCGWPCAANGVKDAPQRVATALCRAALLAVAGEASEDD